LRFDFPVLLKKTTKNQRKFLLAPTLRADLSRIQSKTAVFSNMAFGICIYHSVSKDKAVGFHDPTFIAYLTTLRLYSVDCLDNTDELTRL
jgi:hypothetical protein